MAGQEWYQPDHPVDTPPDVKLDTTVPHIARIYDFWLGGKDNFEADRVAGQRAMDANPSLYQGVRGNRAFLQVERFFAGLDLVEPGVVRIPEWRPDSDLDRINPAEVWGGVARKP